MVDARKARGGRARMATVPPRPRKSLVFFPSPAAIASPVSEEDVTSIAFSKAVSAGKTQEVFIPLEEEEEEKEEGVEVVMVEGSASSLGRSPSPPPVSTIITAEVTSSSSSSTKFCDAVVDPEALMRACSAAASSSEDDLSRKVAAALLRALEKESAVAAGRREGEDGRLDVLSKQVEKVWIAVLCFGSLFILFALMTLVLLASWNGVDWEWSSYPPPT